MLAKEYRIRPGQIQKDSSWHCNSKNAHMKGMSMKDVSTSTAAAFPFQMFSPQCIAHPSASNIQSLATLNSSIPVLICMQGTADAQRCGVVTPGGVSMFLIFFSCWILLSALRKVSNFFCALRGDLEIPLETDEEMRVGLGVTKNDPTHGTGTGPEPAPQNPVPRPEPTERLGGERAGSALSVNTHRIRCGERVPPRRPPWQEPSPALFLRKSDPHPRGGSSQPALFFQPAAFSSRRTPPPGGGGPIFGGSSPPFFPA